MGEEQTAEASNRSYTGSLSSVYVDKTGPDSLNALHERPATTAMLGEVNGLDVVDLGAGDGFYAVELARRGAASVVGLEGGPELVEHARVRATEARVSDRVEMRQHNLEDPMPFLSTGSIDLAVSALALHHIARRAEFYAEVHRILKPGGQFLLSTTHPFADWAKFGGSYFERRWVSRPVGDHGDAMEYELAPLSVWINEFLAAGFQLLEMQEPQPVPELGDVDPVKYERLMSDPVFMVFRLQRD